MPATPPPTLVFSHANGYPAGTYRQLFQLWQAAGWRVAAVDKFGHDPQYPVTSNWPRLRDQLVDFIEAQACGPVWLVGHSLGGLLSLMATCKRPDLVRGLVLLDSPVITGWRAHSVQMLKLSGLMARVSPARISRTRRHEWPSRKAVAAHYGAKALFARWAPGMLNDYLACGTIRRGGKTVLAFEREVETRIYNTLPHHLGQLLKRHPPHCPVSFIAGTRSSEIRQGGLETSRALAGERFRWIDGTHLYPMEKPAETAALVLDLLAGMPDSRQVAPL
ncbi:alpha/beta fold hydrolase [Aquabacterium sp.]|uniref:alpha/beta fold hydrolase n=1 Tax=Aquabacterium sp. TaxID=1872578 RepID=UPI002BC38054|nr:alpha/beta hydrolase [Aquabacterium sp.]HSW08506.1 alpha/beta hydrolase [Aquabacterium sp.]